MTALASGYFSPEPIPAGVRVAARIEYDGAVYSGWQSQPEDSVMTVQDALELALAEIAQCPVRVHCAGRTDTGVHGHCQIVHFEPDVARSSKAWTVGVNASLPPDIRVHWAQPVPDDFHARYSATYRRYRYLILNTPVRSAILHGQVTWYRRPLDTQLMDSAAQHLLGERDFSAFRAASCQSTTPMRNVQHASVRQLGDLIVLDIQANAFLHHMVRNIAGSLMAVGDGRQPPEWIAQLLESRDRTLAADTAPASGLYLVDVGYPKHFGLPETPFGPAIVGTLSAI